MDDKRIWKNVEGQDKAATTEIGDVTQGSGQDSAGRRTQDNREHSSRRHGRACPDHPRPSSSSNDRRLYGRQSWADWSLQQDHL